MKREMIILLVVLFLVNLIGFGSAKNCLPEITLLNQDPYPAIPGEYVKLIFQVEGLVNSECGKVYLELVEDYPIKFDRDAEKNTILTSGNYVTNYNSDALVPFKVRINETTLDGENEIWIKYTIDYLGPGSSNFLEKFELAVNNTKTDFEISIKDYDLKTGILTFEIVNVGKNGVEGLTVDLLKQEAFDVKGSVRSIIGSLDSNEDTSFTFEGYPKKGEINLVIKYNDKIGVRREIDKKVLFDPDLYVGRIKEQVKPNYTGYVIILIIIIIVIIWFFNKARRKKKIERMQLLSLRKK